jgi:hypothetical protein
MSLVIAGTLTVEIGDGADKLVFRNLRPLPDGSPFTIDVELRSSGLAAELPVYASANSGFQDVARFFADMARDWRGWEGTRRYESLEGDLAIAASHHGHVALDVELVSHTHEWTASAHVTINPGEDLARAAAEIDALLGRA